MWPCFSQRPILTHSPASRRPGHRLCYAMPPGAHAQGTPRSQERLQILLETTFIDPLPCSQSKCASSSSHFPQQCPKQLTTCCRGSQTSLPLTGPSTRWLTFWVLEPRPGSPADRLPWKGKLGELFICGEFCWLPRLPPALAPVLKLRTRLKVFSEQETGKPLQRSRCQSAVVQGGWVPSLSPWPMPAKLPLCGENAEGLAHGERAGFLC